jgi:hypothetical protein
MYTMMHLCFDTIHMTISVQLNQKKMRSEL